MLQFSHWAKLVEKLLYQAVLLESNKANIKRCQTFGGADVANGRELLWTEMLAPPEEHMRKNNEKLNI